MRPADSPAYPRSQWFNVFVLHQNRLQHTASAKNTIREDYLAHFLDLVIWGHEHECIPEPWVRRPSPYLCTFRELEPEVTTTPAQCLRTWPCCPVCHMAPAHVY